MNHVILFTTTRQLEELIEALVKHLVDALGGVTEHSDDTTRTLNDVIVALQNSEEHVQKFVVLRTGEVTTLHNLLGAYTDGVVNGTVKYDTPQCAYLLSNVRAALFTAMIFGVGQVDI